MRYALTFGVLGLVLALIALRLAGEAVGGWWRLVVIEAYLAVCLLSLATVYGLRHLGVPVEDLLVCRGWSRAARALPLHYPALAGLTLLLTSRLSREALMCEVGPRLLSSGCRSPGSRTGWRTAGAMPS